MTDKNIQNSKIIEKVGNKKNIIWDWNGTLMDDVDIAIISVNKILEENKLPTIDEKRYREVFGFPIKDCYSDLGFDLKSLSFDHLSKQFHDEYEKNRVSLGKIFPDVPFILNYFSSSKKQSILSAGAQWLLDEWVKQFNLDNYFEYIFGIDNLFATSKVDRGSQLLKEAKYDPNETILIGDTDHDLQVGHELGIEVLLVANGHQSYERLIKLHNNVIETRF